MLMLKTPYYKCSKFAEDCDAVAQIKENLKKRLTTQD